jgi:hypothetical protein
MQASIVRCLIAQQLCAAVASDVFPLPHMQDLASFVLTFYIAVPHLHLNVLSVFSSSDSPTGTAHSLAANEEEKF